MIKGKLYRVKAEFREIDNLILVEKTIRVRRNFVKCVGHTMQLRDKIIHLSKEMITYSTPSFRRLGKTTYMEATDEECELFYSRLIQKEDEGIRLQFPYTYFIGEQFIGAGWNKNKIVLNAWISSLFHSLPEDTEVTIVKRNNPKRLLSIKNLKEEYEIS